MVNQYVVQYQPILPHIGSRTLLDHHQISSTKGTTLYHQPSFKLRWTTLANHHQPGFNITTGDWLSRTVSDPRPSNAFLIGFLDHQHISEVIELARPTSVAQAGALQKSVFCLATEHWLTIKPLRSIALMSPSFNHHFAINEASCNH